MPRDACPLPPEWSSGPGAAALGIFRAQRDRLEEANTLRLIAIARRKAGNLQAAQHAWQAALPILSDLGHDLPAFDPFTLQDNARTWE